jgi:hypothetical protein
MPDDVDDAELELAEMTGIENSWAGRVLLKTFRAVKVLRGRVNVLNARTQALEDRVSALENPPPP